MADDKKPKGLRKVWRVMSIQYETPVDFSSRQDAEKYVANCHRPEFHFIVPMHETGKMREALKKFLQFRCEGIPGGFRRREGYSKGDEDAPFFSEAFLYVLLGKGDARSVLGLMNHACLHAGMGREEQVAAQAEKRKDEW